MTNYPKMTSLVEVIFIDGVSQEYTINASSSLTSYLTRQAAETGFLVLLCGPKTHAIPVAMIREWTITEISERAE